MGAELQRPLLAPWYRLVPDGDRLLLEHGRVVVVVEGRAVRMLLPRLLPLLDGTRTLEELTEVLGGPSRRAIDTTIDRLAEHGLVVEGPPGGGEAAALAALYRLSPAEAAKALAGTRIGVIGRSPVGAQAARVLRRGGVSHVERLSPAGRPDVDLALVTPSREEASLLGEWNDRALAHGLCWIGVRPFDGHVWSIGPLVVPGESCCYQCLLHRVASHLDYGQDLPLIEARPPRASGGPALELVAVGVLVQSALGWAVGRDPSLPGMLHVVEARPGLAIETHRVLRVPRCAACSPVEHHAPRLPWHEAGLAAEVAA